MPIINNKLQNYRSRVDEIVKDLHSLTIFIAHKELAETVSELRNRINEPFMFVIVGEVKAGKSSFINALLQTDKEICKVSPAPMTDTIQQITYGDEEAEIVVNPYLKKLYYQIEILKEISIVDTPGTNTIIAHHQEITESFIPASDLIVFVFEAKNPYRQSAWDFLDFIYSDWRRKIIFVLQQKDLLNENDLMINMKGVSEFAQKKGIVSPQIFSVSAKDELDKKYEISGFPEIRNFIEKNITGGKASFLKLENNIQTSININERIFKGLSDRKQQLESDIIFRNDIKETLSTQEIRSFKQVDILVENLLAGYDKITLKAEKDLDNELSFILLLKRTFTSIFSKKTSSKAWLEALSAQLENDLSSDLKRRLEDSANDLADTIQQMAKIIDLKIQSSKTILKDNHDIFSDISDRRAHVLKELQEAFGKFINRSENFSGEESINQNQAIAPNIATGSGLAIVGIVLATTTKLAVLDITGGVLTAVGVLFAGITMGVSRYKILKNYREEVIKGRERLSDEVTEKLKSYIKIIKSKIDSNFINFDAMIENENQQVKLIGEKHNDLKNRLLILEKEIHQVIE